MGLFYVITVEVLVVLCGVDVSIALFFPFQNYENLTNLQKV